MDNIQVRVSLAVLLVMHVVGLAGLNIDRFRPDFIPLIWINLVFLFCIVLSLHSKWNLNYLYFVAGVFALGFVVELIGVRTHAIFGAYSYQGNLGMSLMGVPLVIGMNWVVLTYCCGALARRIDPSLFIRVVAGALLMVGLDVLIEPFAIRYDLWQWSGGTPPLRNYAGWLITSLVAQIAYQKLLAKTSNPIAVPTFLILLFFFLGDWILARMA